MMKEFKDEIKDFKKLESLREQEINQIKRK